MVRLSGFRAQTTLQSQQRRGTTLESFSEWAHRFWRDIQTVYVQALRSLIQSLALSFLNDQRREECRGHYLCDCFRCSWLQLRMYTSLIAHYPIKLTLSAERSCYCRPLASIHHRHSPAHPTEIGASGSRYSKNAETSFCSNTCRSEVGPLNQAPS